MAPLPRLLADALDDRLALRVTLVILLIRPPGDDLLRGATWLVAGAALAVPILVNLAGIWFALAALMGVRLALEFPLADNHLYLLAYWCLAIALALCTTNAIDTLRRSARWLVAAAFTCAVVWKALLAPDFLDARFFRVTLVTDPRFATLARSVGQLSEAQLAANRDALAPLDAGIELVDGPVLVEPPPLRALGFGLTWGGLLLEAAVAIAFLARAGLRVLRVRHILLLAFCVVTYAIAPVGGFGWLLAAMGMAQTASRGWRAAYASVCALVLLYAETPIVTWVVGMLAP